MHNALILTCYSLSEVDGCNYTFDIEVTGFSGNPAVDFVTLKFQILGDAVLDTVTSSVSGFNIYDDDSSVDMYYFSSPIETEKILGKKFSFTVKGTPNKSFTIKRVDSWCGVFQVNGFGRCFTTGSCGEQQFFVDSHEVSGIVTAPGYLYDCPATENHGIEGANVSISSTNGESRSTTTANNGTYSRVFGSEGPYEICLETVCDSACGLTDFDIVKLQKLILTDKGWTKDLYIIGDVNRNGDVNTLDLLFMELEILNKPTPIDNWCRFVPVHDYGLAPEIPANGIASQQVIDFYKSMDNCLTVNSSYVSKDFLRYTLGDMDVSCSDCIHGDNNGVLRSTEGFTSVMIDRDDSNLLKNKIRSSENDKIHALTLHVEIPSGVTVSSVKSPLPDFDYAIRDNEIHFIWVDLTENGAGYFTKENEVLLEIETDQKCNLNLATNENYWLSAEYGIRQVVKESLESNSLSKSQFVSINGQSAVTISQVVGNGVLSMFDISGRLILSQKIDDKTSRIDTEIKVGGIYILAIEDETGLQSYKVFLQ